MVKLSVVIITFNEEKNIGRCLDSVKDIADDIVIIDSFSTDKTEEICKKYSENFIQRKWEGYSATKNFANEQAKFDWILSLDADEALSEKLKKSIVEWKKLSEAVPAKFSRLSNYCGQWIHHCGWYPDIKVRIFNRRNAKWSGKIHEKLIIDNPEKVFHLLGDCLHYTYYTIDEHRKQVDGFTDLMANDLMTNGSKPNLIIIYLSPIAKFFNSYFLKLGFLDGYYGFIICKISAKATFLKYWKLKKLYESQENK